MGLDDELFRAVHEGWRSPALDPVMVVLSILGLLYFWLLFAVPLGIRLGRRAALRMVLLLLLDAAAVAVLKVVVARPRPEAAAIPVPLDASPIESAFPSGHASRAAAAVTWLATTNPGFLLLAPYAVAIGLSRIYVGVHWPSDVVGGWAFGTGLGLGASRLFRTELYQKAEDRFLAKLSALMRIKRSSGSP